MPDGVDTASPCGVNIRPPSTDLWSWRGVGDLDLAPELGAAVELTEQDGLGARRLARGGVILLILLSAGGRCERSRVTCYGTVVMNS